MVPDLATSSRRSSKKNVERLSRRQPCSAPDDHSFRSFHPVNGQTPRRRVQQWRLIVACLILITGGLISAIQAYSSQGPTPIPSGAASAPRQSSFLYRIQKSPARTSSTALFFGSSPSSSSRSKEEISASPANVTSTVTATTTATTESEDSSSAPDETITLASRIADLCAKQREYEQRQRNSASSSEDSCSAPPDTPYWRQAWSLLKENAKDPSLSTASYDAVLTCLARQQRTNVWREALGLLRQMEQSSNSNVSPTLTSYRSVIDCCVASHQAEQAAQVLESAIRKGIHLDGKDKDDRRTQNTLIHMFEVVMCALSRKVQWRRAVQLLNVLEHDLHLPATLTAYNALIAACSKAREVVQAKNLLVRMRKPPSRLKPSVNTYNSVLSCCASTNRWRDALSVLDQCHREPGVTPDIYTYTNAIRACAKGGKTQRALSLLQVVQDLGLPIDTYCYTAAIEACAKAKQWRKALELLEEMEARGIAPSEVTYSVTISACGNGGQWKKALELLDEMREKGLPINIITYNAAITALSKAAKQGRTGNDDGQLWTRVMGLLDQMKSDGIQPDGFTFSSAIACCGAEGRWEEALKLMERMQSGGPRMRPNKIAYTAAISSCGRSGQADHAIRLFRQMEEQGLSADRVAYNALFSAFRVAKKADEAYELWKEMCGVVTSASKQPPRRAAAKSGASTRPDIISLTEVLAAMATSSGDPLHRQRIDEVFSDAVQRGIVLKDTLDSDNEFDLSGMSLPVARAACRFIVHRILAYDSSNDQEKAQLVMNDGLTFITGVGVARGHGRHQNDERFTSLREFVCEVLVTDFDPPLVSTVVAGTVRIDKETLRDWYQQQQLQN